MQLSDLRLTTPRDKKIAAGYGVPSVLVLIVVLIVNTSSGGGDTPNADEKVTANASDTSSSLSDALKESDQKIDDEKAAKIKKAADDKAAEIAAAEKKAADEKAAKIKKAADDKAAEIAAAEKKAADEKAAAEPEVLADISISGTEYTKFVSYKLIGGTDNLSALARELASIGGVNHKENGTEGDLVIFSRSEKPTQTVMKISVTTKGITVVFREDPTPEHLEAVAKTLLTAAKSLGVEVGEVWQGKGASRTLLPAVAKTDN